MPNDYSAAVPQYDASFDREETIRNLDSPEFARSIEQLGITPPEAPPVTLQFRPPGNPGVANSAGMQQVQQAQARQRMMELAMLRNQQAGAQLRPDQASAYKGLLVDMP